MIHHDEENSQHMQVAEETSQPSVNPSFTAFINFLMAGISWLEQNTHQQTSPQGPDLGENADHRMRRNSLFITHGHGSY